MIVYTCTWCGESSVLPEPVPAMKCVKCARVTQNPGSTEVKCRGCNIPNYYFEKDCDSFLCYACGAVNIITNVKISVMDKPDEEMEATEAITSAKIGQLLSKCRAKGQYDRLAHTVCDVFSSQGLLCSSFIRTTPAITQSSVPCMEEGDIMDVRESYELISASDVHEDVRKALLNGTRQLLAKKRSLENPEHLRMFLIVLENPCLNQSEYQPVLCDLSKQIFAMFQPWKDALFQYWCSCGNNNGDQQNGVSVKSESFVHTVATIRNFITMRVFMLETQRMNIRSDGPIEAAIDVLNILHCCNQRTHLLSQEDFYIEALTDRLDLRSDYQSWIQNMPDFSFVRFSFCLSLALKSKVLSLDVARTIEEEARVALAYLMRGVRASPYLHLKVKRESVIMDTLNEVFTRQGSLHRPLKITFIGEPGSGTGPVREFFQLFIRELFYQDRSLFIHHKHSRKYYFNPRMNNAEMSSHYELLGIIIGLALQNHVLLDLHLPSIVYRWLLGNEHFSLDDLIELAPSLGRGLKQLLDYNGDVQQHLGVTYTIAYEFDGRTEVVPLMPGGEEIYVNAENRVDYVSKYIEHKLVQSVRPQLDAVKSGFSSVVGWNVLRILAPEELGKLLVGTPVVDVSVVEEAAAYDGYTSDHDVIRLFWRVVRDMSLDLQKRLLLFVTGSECLPHRGVAFVDFTIVRDSSGEGRLPSAHSCFGRLLLPPYNDYETMKQKLITSLENGEGFSFK